MECRIIVRGHLDRMWSDWLHGLQISEQPDGTTLLSGRLPDQAALYGVLCQMRDLGMPLASLTCGEPATVSTSE